MLEITYGTIVNGRGFHGFKIENVALIKKMFKICSRNVGNFKS